MKREVFINYSSIITGLGNLDQTWDALLKKSSAIIKKNHFDNFLLPQTGLSLYKRETSSSLKNVALFLIKECFFSIPEIPEDSFVIWTGIKNTAEYIESLCSGQEPPLYSSEYDLCKWVIEYLGLKKGGMTVSASCASSTVGTAIASQFISEGRYNNVLVVGCDFVTSFVYYGFASLKAMTDEICKPFDRNRKGLTLGDGAFALLLSSERKSDIRISGWSITNDANHITGPSRDGEGLANSLKAAIDMASLKPPNIQAICAHGTGTNYNDAMEIKAFNKIFGENPPLTFGIKGAIGHTLGAAGGIEIAISKKCLEERVIPPTVGCEEPEANFISLEKVNFSGSNIISCNSGFGGVNASIVMEMI